MLTTRVATGTVRSVKRRSKPSGSTRSAPICWRCRTTTSSSRCRKTSAHFPCRTSVCYGDCLSPDGLLFRAVSETLLTIARDPKHLGARIGFTAVLHTWGQTLLHHPHVHCVVPAGGLALDGEHWIPAREGFFLPVRVLSRLFRGKYLAYLREAHEAGKLVLADRLKELASPDAWRAFLNRLRQIEWVVYAKPPFGSPEQVLKYLARYTHRVAISNRRISSIDGGYVAFRYKDYRRGRSDRIMRLPAAEFIRRFLLHVLPKRFVRIRHYGLLANRKRKENLSLCRQLLRTSNGPTSSAATEASPPSAHSDPSESAPVPAPHDSDYACPVCKRGQLVIIARIPPSRAGPVICPDVLCHA